MGIPKFFRWISERYPACSQVVIEIRIPEFDNLYLDMNGIIHNASHPQDSHSSCLSEEEIMANIFSYLEVLFAKIKPRKLFFLALDGVAPRAKMNQQRARRFRTAKEAEEARKKGDKTEDDFFDSNCITPGTEFMSKLSMNLRYFIAKKVSEDEIWQQPHIIFSGSEVPGEGEHKIMEFIRNSKAQPDYPPNLRHCLYGLDADLIMLGLVSHEPHFALLREEVIFGGKKRTNSTANGQNTNFHLLHICMLIEYLEMEFSCLSSLPHFSLPRVIDDFVMMMILLGNDFVPNLAGLDISTNGLEFLFQKYKQCMPKFPSSRGRYLNEFGSANLENLQYFVSEISEKEVELFDENFHEKMWTKYKRRTQFQDDRLESKNTRFITASQAQLWHSIRRFLFNEKEANITFKDDMTFEDVNFLMNLSRDCNLEFYRDPNIVIYLIKKREEAATETDSEDSVDELEKAILLYDNAIIDSHDNDAVAQLKFETTFNEWKAEYYKSKMEIDYKDANSLNALVKSYIEGIEWILRYYYHGVNSWGWFYPYHYAPRMSDIKDIASFEISFELGTPFKPFEQLMGVLPPACHKLVPSAYHTLMLSSTSPISDFYPKNFKTDMNDKKSSWEAIVLIPFIDQSRLVQSLKPFNSQLSEVEKKRNEFGVTWLFSFHRDAKETFYPSPLKSAKFPDFSSRCQMSVYDLPVLKLEDKFVLTEIATKRLYGFPSLKSLKCHGSLGKIGVKVFQQETRNVSMILVLENQYFGMSAEEIQAKFLANPVVHFGWPFQFEGLVDYFTDGDFEYILMGDKFVKTALSAQRQAEFERQVDNCERFSVQKLGLQIGAVDFLVYVKALKGLQELEDGSKQKEYSATSLPYPLQTVLMDVDGRDGRFVERGPVSLSERYPVASRGIYVGTPYYGSSYVINNVSGIKINVTLNVLQFDTVPSICHPDRPTYFPSFEVAKILNIHPLTLSKVTSSVQVMYKNQRFNIGLGLKFDGKGLKVLGMTRKGQKVWEFSENAIKLIGDYKKAFPAVFQAISSSTLEYIEAEDIFDENDKKLVDGVLYEGAEQIVLVKKWLKKLDSFETVDINTESFSTAEIVEMTEASNLSMVKFDEKSLNVTSGLISEKSTVPHKASSFLLGDIVAVLNAQNQGTVNNPLRCGQIGIIVKLATEVADVLIIRPGASSIATLPLDCIVEVRKDFKRAEEKSKFTQPQSRKVKVPTVWHKDKTQAVIIDRFKGKIEKDSVDDLSQGLKALLKIDSSSKKEEIKVILKREKKEENPKNDNPKSDEIKEETQSPIKKKEITPKIIESPKPKAGSLKSKAKVSLPKGMVPTSVRLASASSKKTQ